MNTNIQEKEIETINKIDTNNNNKKKTLAQFNKNLS